MQPRQSHGAGYPRGEARRRGRSGLAPSPRHKGRVASIALARSYTQVFYVAELGTVPLWIEKEKFGKEPQPIDRFWWGRSIRGGQRDNAGDGLCPARGPAEVNANIEYYWPSHWCPLNGYLLASAASHGHANSQWWITNTLSAAGAFCKAVTANISWASELFLPVWTTGIWNDFSYLSAFESQAVLWWVYIYC